MTRKAAKRTMANPPPTKIEISLPTVDVMRKVIDDRFGPVAQMLAKHEGLRTKVYEDRAANGEFKGHAIGVGRNLTHKGISQQEALLMYYNDLVDWTDEIVKHVPEYEKLDDVRKAVLIDMAHTLDASGLGRFTNTRRALAEQNWLKAAYEMGDSLWYEQQPFPRSARLLTMMVSGKLEKNWGDEEREQYEWFSNAERRNFQAAIGKSPSDPVQIVAAFLPQKPKRSRSTKVV